MARVAGVGGGLTSGRTGGREVQRGWGTWVNWDNPGPRAKWTGCEVHCRWPSGAAGALGDLVHCWDGGVPNRIEFQVNCPLVAQGGDSGPGP